MVPLTRRRLLHGAAGTALALAGCNELVSGTDESTRTVSDARSGETQPRADSEVEPTFVRLRSAVDRPPVWLSDSTGNDASRPTSDDRREQISGTVIDSPSRADRLTIAEVPARERARTFLSETDYETQTVYLDTNHVQECFTLELCRVSWQPDHVETDYGRVIRPYDERCGADAKVYEARLIRIPDALDHENVNRHSSSIGAGSCDGDSPRPEASGEDAGESDSTTNSSEPTAAAIVADVSGGDQ